jgi:hypothetical protein
MLTLRTQKKGWTMMVYHVLNGGCTCHVMCVMSSIYILSHVSSTGILVLTKERKCEMLYAE